MRPFVVVASFAGVALGGIIAWLLTPDLPARTLEKRYGVSPVDYVLVAGVRLHLLDTGPRTAPAVILLHGFGSSLQTWDAWAAPLSTNHRVIRYDLPGFGLTGADPTGDYSAGRGVGILAALMEQLGVTHASVVGNSMGGMLAWQFAASYPARVDRLVLISPDGFASPGFDYGKVPQVPLMLRALPYTLPRFMLRMSLASAFADPSKMNDGLIDRYWDMIRAPGVRRAIIMRTAQTVLADPHTALARIRAPTMVIWGERDAMIPFNNAANYLNDIPDATLQPLPGLGHVPQEEAPAQSLAPVAAFLAP